MAFSAMDAVFVILCVVAAGWDFRRRVIPNLLNLVILVAGVVSVVLVALSDADVSPLSHLLHFAIALVAAMLLFRFGWWGGGDGKFYAAIAAWFPLAGAVPLAVWTALMGAVLVAAMGLHGKAFRVADWQKNLPYGAAIAAGALMARFGPQVF